jgi:hypothetical protein
MKILLRATLHLFVLFSLAILPPAPAGIGSEASRIVAVGDIHGAFPELVNILQKTGLIDGDRNWSGGTATLVQMGDVLDRGAQTRACLDLLMKLQGQAGRTGGRVVTLLGNHEAMNLMGDLRYVTPEIYQSFAGPQSEKLRERAYQDYRQYIAGIREGAAKKGDADESAERLKWMDAHPPGFFEYRDALGPTGTYGRWIRKHRAIYQAADGLFVHGGLNPNLNFRSVAEIEDRVSTELSGFDTLWNYLSGRKLIWKYMTLAEGLDALAEQAKKIQAQGQPEAMADLPQIQQLLGCKSWMIAASDGPFWYRGLAQDSEEKIRDALLAMLERFKAQFIVEGHTVLSKSEIIARFDGRVFLIDTGMLKEAYSGRASALEILNGQFTAHYADGESKALPGPGKKAPAAGGGTRSR